MAHAGGRPTKYSEDILIKTDQYISECEDNEYEFHEVRGIKSDTYREKVKPKLPSVVGLALFLDISTETIYEWCKEEGKEEFSYKVTRIHNLQHERLMTGGLSGAYNPMIAKLLLSSAHKYRERSDMTTNDKDLPTPIVDLTKLPKPQELEQVKESDLVHDSLDEDTL